MEISETNGHNEPHLRKKSVIPVRLIVAVFLFTGMAMPLAMRTSMSVALVSMVNESRTSMVAPSGGASTCAELLPRIQNQSLSWSEEAGRQQTFDWDERTQALVLGSFFYGWSIAILPGLFVVQRFGGKWPFGLSVFGCSLITLLTPVAASLGAGCLIGVRAIGGFVQGAMPASRSVLVSHWAPITERGRILTFVISGIDIGIVIGMLGSGALADSNIFGGWPSIFYVFGAVGVFWFVLYVLLVHEKPSVHPWISDFELEIIQKNKKGTGITNCSIPWRCMLKSIPLWAVSIAFFGQFWSIHLLITELPAYLSNIMHFNIKSNGFLSSLPSMARFAFCYIAGPITDKLFNSGKFSITTVRKISNMMGLFGISACILIIAFIGCRPAVVIILLCVSMVVNVFSASACHLVAIDMNASYTGVVTGVCYTFASTTGFLVPLVVGEFTRHGQTLENWSYAFMITAAVIFLSGLIFIGFGSAEHQPWSTGIEDNDSKSNNKVLDARLEQTMTQNCERTKL